MHLRKRCSEAQACPTLCEGKCKQVYLSAVGLSCPDTLYSMRFILSLEPRTLCCSSKSCQEGPLVSPWGSISSVQFSHSLVSNSLRSHGLQHARPPCPLPTLRACSNSCPSCWWCRPTISSSVVPFSSCLQSFPASGSFTMGQFFTSGGPSTGASSSASVLPVNIQDWFYLGWTGWVSLQSKRLSRVSNITVQEHQFFGVQLSL